MRELIWQRFGVRLAVRTMVTYLARWSFTAQKRCGAPTSRPRRRCGAGCGGTTLQLPPGPRQREAPSSGVTRPVFAPMTCAVAVTYPQVTHRRCGSITGGRTSA
ncbi:winged helix-turn-helix domain-containing protein [Roseicella frigidaeris]|uniref:winged helix-turn-helix domain-containing protein n=1 Tax=Roseicella frigidaeris TaxID=2230885 RepID=UPI001A9DC3E7